MTNLQVPEHKTFLKLSEDERILISGLMNYYGLTATTVADFFRSTPTNRDLSRKTIGKRKEEFLAMNLKPELRDKLGTKANFDIFLQVFFKERGLLDPQKIIRDFSESQRALSFEDKTVVAGLAKFFNLSIVSIERICRVRINWFPNYTTSKSIIENSQKKDDEVAKYLSTLSKEDFLDIVLRYFKFESKTEAEDFFSKYREKQIHVYSEEEKKIIYGLYKYAGLAPQKIVELLKDRYPNLKDVTKKEVALLCVACGRIPNLTSKEETETLIGVSIEELSTVFSGLIERKKKNFSEREKLFLIAWVDYGGSVESLRRFLEKYWHYKTKNKHQTNTTIWKIRQEFKKTQIELLSKSSFLREIEKLGVGDFKNLLYELESETDERNLLNLLEKDDASMQGVTEEEKRIVNYFYRDRLQQAQVAELCFVSVGEVRRAVAKVRNRYKMYLETKVAKEEKEADLSRLEKYKKYAVEEDCAPLMSKILQSQIKKDVILPMSISCSMGKFLLQGESVSGLGNTAVIRLVDLPDFNVDVESPGLSDIKRKIRGLIYLLSRPGRLEKIFDFWRSKGVVLDGVRLEAFALERAIGDEKELIYKGNFVSSTAKLLSIDDIGK